MLDSPRFRHRDHGDYAEPPPEREFFSLAEVAALLRRYMWTIVGCLVIALVLAFAYLVTARPVYMARAQLIIDPQSSQVLRQQTGQADTSLDTAAVESQIVVLRSEKIAIAVLNDLGASSEFAAKPAAAPGFHISLSAVIGWIRRRLPGAQGAPPLDVAAAARAAELERRQSAIDAFESGLDVRRVGLSYAIDIFFSAHDPGAAAVAANATADAYIRDQVEARAQAARAGGAWLESRITQLRNQMNTAAAAVQEFKAAHNLVDTGDRGSLSDQQVTQLNRQLLDTRARTVDARARLDRVNAILAQDIPDAAVVEVLANQTINTLRARYLDAATKLSDALARYGDNQPPVENLRHEMAADLQGIHAELRRIGATYQSDYDVATSREAALAADLHRQILKATESKRAGITVAQLETTAQTYRKIYESFLQAYTESVQRQSFPVSDARVITQASTPTQKSRPRAGLILAFAILIGSMSGIGIAIVRKGLDRSIRTAAQIRDEIGLECLGLLPALAFTGRGRRRRAMAASPFDEVLIRPFSNFSDNLKTVRASVGIADDARTLGSIGVTSALRGEGKSTIAVNLGRLLAGGGSRTLLIDADIRASSVTAALAPGAKSGLLEAVTGLRPVETLIVRDPLSKLDFLPIVGAGQIAGAGDLLGSRQMRLLLEHLRGSYDVIVVDMPPVMDALGLSAVMDAVLMVAEWGKTPANVMMETLHALHTVQARLHGAVITKVAAPTRSRHAKRTFPVLSRMG